MQSAEPMFTLWVKTGDRFPRCIFLEPFSPFEYARKHPDAAFVFIDQTTPEDIDVQSPVYSMSKVCPTEDTFYPLADDDKEAEHIVLCVKFKHRYYCGGKVFEKQAMLDTLPFFASLNQIYFINM
jgi:hypothetical protein